MRPRSTAPRTPAPPPATVARQPVAPRRAAAAAKPRARTQKCCLRGGSLVVSYENSEPPPSLLLENFARRSLRAAYAGGKTAELHPVFDSIQRSRGIECLFQEKQLRKSESATASPARRGSGGVVEWVRFMPTCLRARERLRTPGFVVNKILNCANGRSIMPLHATRRTPRHCCLSISITPSRTAPQPEHAAQTPPPPAPCSPTPLQKCLFSTFRMFVPSPSWQIIGI
jgi:hypothetical protein